MGQASSEEQIRQHLETANINKRAIISQIIIVEREKVQLEKKAKQALRLGQLSNAESLSKQVAGANMTLSSLNTHVGRLDGMNRSIVVQQASSTMVARASSYINIGKALNKEISKEEIAEIAAEYKATKKDLEDRENTIAGMFGDEEKTSLEATDILTQFKEQIALETMQNMPDAKMNSTQESLKKPIEKKVENFNKL